ncbi:MAG: class B sortase [Eubacteriales bacterium]|nr:class B sortase [Eubacteriales bacterium]
MQKSTVKSSQSIRWLVLAALIIAALAVTWFAVGRDALDGVNAAQTDQRTKELYYGKPTSSLWTVLLSSASAEGPGPGPADGGLVDGGLVDGGLVDGGLVDGGLADGGLADGGLADGGLEDGSLADGGPADGSLADGGLADEEAMPEKFRTLYGQNPDVVGWLKMGENVDSPVVQRDNSWYLDHSFFGEKDRNGTLFVNANNQIEPRDDVLLIHGHDMKSGAMFGKLLNFREESYLRQYPLVYFRTIYNDEDTCYVPIAGFDASMLPGKSSYFDITQMVFPTDNPDAPQGEPRQSVAFEQYLASLAERSYWPSPVDVNVEDELLMLVTCSYIQEDGRFMLVCRKLREGESPEQMMELLGAEK